MTDDRRYEPPECCGLPCGWAERAGVWVCQHRAHHWYNDAGEPVDDEGNTEWQAQIVAARRANPSRHLD